MRTDHAELFPIVVC